MKTRIAAAVAVVLLAVTLTGCGEDTTPAADAQSRSFMQQSKTDATPAPVEAEPTPTAAPAAPFVADVPTPTAPTVDETLSKWRTFVLKTIAMNDAGYFQKPSDADPIGQYICNEHRAGAAPENIVAIQNLPEGREHVNSDIVNWTLMHGYSKTTPDEVLPDFCGTVFVAE